MNYATLFKTLSGHFNTLIATPNSLTTQYDNQRSFTAPEGSIWARCSVKTASAYQTEISDPSARIPGIMIISLFSPNEGDADLLALVDKINDAFFAVDIDGVTYETPVVTILGRTGELWQVNVDINFFVQHFK